MNNNSSSYKDLNLASLNVGYGFRALLHTEKVRPDDDCAFLRILRAPKPGQTVWHRATDSSWYADTTQEINDRPWFADDTVIFRRAVEAPAGFRILGPTEIVPATGSSYLDVRASGETFNAGGCWAVTGKPAHAAVDEINGICNTPRTAAIMVRIEEAKPAKAIPAIPAGWTKLDGSATCTRGDKYVFNDGAIDDVVSNLGMTVSEVFSKWRGDDLCYIIRKTGAPKPAPAKTQEEPKVPYGYYRLGAQEMIDASKGDRYFRRDGQLGIGTPAHWNGRSVEAAMDWFNDGYGNPTGVFAVVRPIAIPAGYTLVPEKDKCVEGDRYLFAGRDTAGLRVDSNIGKHAEAAVEHMVSDKHAAVAIVRPIPQEPSELEKVKQELAQVKEELAQAKQELAKERTRNSGLERENEIACENIKAMMDTAARHLAEIEAMKKNASGNAVLKDGEWSRPLRIPAQHDRVVVPTHAMPALAHSSTAYPALFNGITFRKTDKKDGFGRAIFERAG